MWFPGSLATAGCACALADDFVDLGDPVTALQGFVDRPDSDAAAGAQHAQGCGGEQDSGDRGRCDVMSGCRLDRCDGGCCQEWR